VIELQEIIKEISNNKLKFDFIMFPNCAQRSGLGEGRQQEDLSGGAAQQIYFYLSARPTRPGLSPSRCGPY